MVCAILGRPVRWAETRTQNMLGMYHGRAEVHECELGGTRDGKLLAYRLRVLADCGAYPFDGVMLPYLTRLMAGGVYALDRVDVEIVAVVTNTTPIGAFRRRGPSGGDGRDRTHGRPFRGGDRCRLGGGAPPQLHPARRVPVLDAHEGQLRQR